MSDDLEALQERYSALKAREAELDDELGDSNDIVQYIKLTILETRDMDARTKPSVSGLQLLRIDDTVAEFSDAWCNTWSSSIKPEHIIDGNPETAWEDEKMRPVILELSEPAALLGYRMRSSASNPDADPMHWRLEGSTEKDGNWHLLHEQKDDGNLPKDRSSWSVLIPMRPELEDDELVKVVKTSDEMAQEARYLDIDRKLSEDLAKNGPTPAEVDTLARKERELKRNLKADRQEADDITEELELLREQVKKVSERKKEFSVRLLEKVKILAEVVEEQRTKHEAADQLDPKGSVRIAEVIELEREGALSQLQRETESFKVDDTALTASVTDLQNRCLTRLPQIKEEADRTTNGILHAAKREMADLEDAYMVLDAKHRELAFHTKRGTNFKQAWSAPGQRGKKDKEEGFSAHREAEKSRVLADQEVELETENKRLKRVRIDLYQELEKVKKECHEEEMKLKRVFNEVHKERSQLGQSRCELESICANFSIVIERTREKTLGQTGAKTKGVSPSPIPTKFTLGHGRLSPRPQVSPRRSISPRPHQRPSATPRVHVTPRRVLQ